MHMHMYMYMNIYMHNCICICIGIRMYMHMYMYYTYTFRVNVFYVTIDIVLAQLHQSFIATKEITAKFSILNPVIPAQMNSYLLLEKAKQLQREYETDLSAAFPLQIVHFKESMQSEIAKLSTVKQACIHANC